MSIKNEHELYEPVSTWLNNFLLDNFKTSFVKTYIGANETMSRILRRETFASRIENLSFFNFKIDVFSIVEIKKRMRLIIVECKKNAIGLIHLSQLVGYSQIMMPWRSILLSPKGVNSSLKKFITVHKMNHLLKYGKDGRISICKWHIDKMRPDSSNVLPLGSLDPISFF